MLALADKRFLSLSIHVGHLFFDLSVLFPSIFPPQIPMPKAEGRRVGRLFFPVTMPRTGNTCVRAAQRPETGSSAQDLSTLPTGV